MFFTALPLYRLEAQCPDGSPPPCGRAAPLDENRWIVVPFQNVAHAPDAEWLGAASVNLLYLNLSQWHDLRVVDDERVADLLRSRGAAPLGLSDVMALARRAGAGSVVMGDLLKTGSLLTVVGKVYRVRSGERVRQVTVQVASPDSVLPAYRSLAAQLLDLPPASQAGGIGTTSLDAFREYARGLAALHAWQLDSAEAGFQRAIVADSFFALARYQLARTLGWESGKDSIEAQQLERAAQMAQGLAPRSRALINGYLDLVTGRVEEARALYRELLARDSMDAEAWYSLGETEYHDDLVHRDQAGRLTFGGSWNSAIADFQRVLDLDPAYHLAFAHIGDIYDGRERYGCDHRHAGTYACERVSYAALLRLDGDTILTRPLMLDSLTDEAFYAAMMAAARSGWPTRRAAGARDAAARWVQSGPAEPDANWAYAVALLRTGDLAGASRQLGAIRGKPRRATPRDIMRLRAEIALKQGRYEDAYRLADSLFLMPRDGQGGDPANGWNALLGRFGRWDERGYAEWAPEAKAGFAISTRTLAGFLPPNYAAVEEDFIRFRIRTDPNFHADRPSYRLLALIYTHVFGLRQRPRAGLPADTSSPFSPVINTASALILGDTAAARRFALREEATPDDGFFGPALVTLHAAETFLELGDTARARTDLDRLEHEIFPGFAIDGGPDGSYSVNPAMWGRAFLLQGDLAAAAHDSQTMISAYRRVIGLWSTGDPEVGPAVARARAALAAAGTSPGS